MPTVDYAMSVRSVSKGKFVAGVGPTRFLAVPDGADPDPAQAITASAWYKAVTDAGKWTNDKGEARGDILFVVHGYNESETEVMDRHRRIRDGLAALAFKGVIVSFDWPSGASALAYLPDRHRAKQTALQLVSDGIAQLAARQTPDCPINIHILGHSTGAYVIREAFDDADDSQLRQSSWLVSQICRRRVVRIDGHRRFRREIGVSPLPALDQLFQPQRQRARHLERQAAWRRPTRGPHRPAA